jgi:hypothetical protein
LLSTTEYPAAADSQIEKPRDWAGVFVGERDLRKNAPTVVLTPTDEVVPADVADRKRSASWLNRVERRSRKRDLFDKRSLVVALWPALLLGYWRNTGCGQEL